MTRLRLAWLASIVACACTGHGPSRLPVGTAFYYGPSPPVERLVRAARVVVDAHVLDEGSRRALQAADAHLFAYVSMGEADPSRPWFAELDPGWLFGTNPGWHTRIIDQRQPGWRRYLLDQHVAGLWSLGIRGLFLDTLDSYELAVSDPAARAEQQAALRATMDALTERYPGIELLFNRGFGLLPVQRCVGVAAESLFEGYDSTGHRYRPVPAADRDWLQERLAEVRSGGRAAIVIDYVDPGDPDLARRTAGRIAALGFEPWVAPWSLDRMGIGLADLAE